MLGAMLMIAMIAGMYWNQTHGHKHFVLWLSLALSIPGVPLMLYHFARRRQIVFLLAAIAVACIGVRSAWLLIHR